MNQGDQWLEEIATRMKREIESGTLTTPEKLSVREFLHKFGASRRGDRIISSIRNGLEKHGLITNLDIDNAWIDSPITISLDSDTSESAKAHHVTDPTPRIQSLEAANKKNQWSYVQIKIWKQPRL